MFSELVRPLLAMVPLGYSVSLLLWEAHHAGTEPQPQGTGQHHSIIQQVSTPGWATQKLLLGPVSLSPHWFNPSDALGWDGPFHPLA